MKKHGMSAGGDGPYSTFCMSILVVGTNPREGLSLLALAKSVGPGFTSEDPIVAVVGRDVDATSSGFGFKLTFAGEGVGATKRDLMVDFNKAGGRIKEDGSTNVLRRRSLSTVCMGKTTTNSGFILVDVDTGTWLELLGGEGMFMPGLRLGLFGCRDNDGPWPLDKQDRVGEYNRGSRQSLEEGRIQFSHSRRICT